jgi:hypothetical protein
MFRQTWLGLTCLATLEEAAIAPWESSGTTVIVEVLPALIVRQDLGPVGGYKGRSGQALASRESLAIAIEKRVRLQPADKQQLIDDVEGDAIDAVVAALAALRAHRQGFASPPGHLDEGWIYGAVGDGRPASPSLC